MKLLFLAWQNPDSRRWYPVGKLTETDGCFQFFYVKGAIDAQQDGFCPLPSFPHLTAVYESSEIFPLFANRLLPRSRPDYQEFLHWLSLPKDEDDPFALLARSGGRRVTDTLAVFPCPERDSEGYYHLHFFVHGLSHMTVAARARTEELQPGERLLLMADEQNPHDPKARMLRTEGRADGDLHLLGYFPRYLVDDLDHLLAQLENRSDAAVVRVVRVNSTPAPVQFRLLCSVMMRWPDRSRPFSTDQYVAVESHLS